MCQDKVRAIDEWPTPRIVKEGQAFLGFANFYCQFICDYLRIAWPFTNLILKDQPFEWIP